MFLNICVTWNPLAGLYTASVVVIVIMFLLVSHALGFKYIHSARTIYGLAYECLT
jgi:type III secretory pathway component EscR